MKAKEEDRRSLAERAIAERAERKLARRQEGRQSAWFGLGMFGLVGWSVAVPTLIGALVGLWLDRRYPGPPSWTLTLILVGVLIGSATAWHWVNRESGRR